MRSDCSGSRELLHGSKVEERLLDRLDDYKDEDTVNRRGKRHLKCLGSTWSQELLPYSAILTCTHLYVCICMYVCMYVDKRNLYYSVYLSAQTTVFAETIICITHKL